MNANKISVIIGASLLSVSTMAQSYGINWFSVDGGAGTSSGGGFSISGTLGQPDAGRAMAGDNFAITGGFWSIMGVQTPGAPPLAMRVNAPGQLVISWPSASTGYLVQQSSSLATPDWGEVSEPVSDDGVTKSIVVNSGAGNRYYRLVKQP